MMDIINDRLNNVSFDRLMTDLFYYSVEYVSTHKLGILDREQDNYGLRCTILIIFNRFKI